MAVLTRTLVLLALAACGACQILRDPTAIDATEERVQVNAVLVAGAPRAAVLVTRAGGPPDSLAGAWSVPVGGAEVLLAADGDTVRLEQSTDSARECLATVFTHSDAPDYTPGCYAAAVPGGIRMGATYELLLTLPEGGTVRGITTVPPAPVLLAPEAGDTVWVGSTGASGWPEPVTVRWPPLPEDLLLELHVESDTPGCGAALAGPRRGISMALLDVSGSDSTLLMVSHVHCEGGQTVADTTGGTIILTRYDPAYSRYVRLLGRGVTAIDEEDATVGLTGAIGVFAAAAEARKNVVLARRED